MIFADSKTCLNDVNTYKQQKIIKDSKKTETETKTKIEAGKYTPNKILQDAEASLRSGHYLASVVECATLLEIAFKRWLIKTEVLPEREVQKQPIGRLVRMPHVNAAMDRGYIHDIIEISMIRNKAVHEAEIPSELGAEFVLGRTRALLDRLQT